MFNIIIIVSTESHGEIMQAELAKLKAQTMTKKRKAGSDGTVLKTHSIVTRSQSDAKSSPKIHTQSSPKTHTHSPIETRSIVTRSQFNASCIETPKTQNCSQDNINETQPVASRSRSNAKSPSAHAHSQVENESVAMRSRSNSGFPSVRTRSHLKNQSVATRSHSNAKSPSTRTHSQIENQYFATRSQSDTESPTSFETQSVNIDSGTTKSQPSHRTRSQTSTPQIITTPSDSLRPLPMRYVYKCNVNILFIYLFTDCPLAMRKLQLMMKSRYTQILLNKLMINQ